MMKEGVGGRGPGPDGESGPRDRILERVRLAVADRARVAHPGGFPGVGEPDPRVPPVSRFVERARANGAEARAFDSLETAREWVHERCRALGSRALAEGVPLELAPPLPDAGPEDAGVGVSLALGAAADTGTVLLDSREGRRVQLLPPTHLVWIPHDRVAADLDASLASRAGSLPAALGLHSGPSKSADIGRVLVTGVHGPGTVLFVVAPIGSPGRIA